MRGGNSGRGLPVLTFVAALLLGGCAVFKIVAPTANQSFPNSTVPSEIDWAPDYQPNTFKVVLDPSAANVDVTSQFTITSVQGGYKAAATLNVPAGQHVLMVSGSLYTWYTQGYANASTQQTFTVQGVPGTLGITASPNPFSLTGTAASNLTVGVTIGGSASGPATITVTGLPSQVIATPTTLTFNANGSSPTSVSAAGSVVANSYSFTLSGTATNANGSANVTLHVIPTITSATPATQKRGGTIALSGTHFDPNCANDKITIGGATVSPTGPCSPTSLTFAVPAGASPGATSIVANVNGQASAGFAATVMPTEVVVVAGPASTKFAVIDFTDPMNPSSVLVDPGFGGLVVDCSGKHAAVGSATSGTGQTVMYDISNPASPTKLGSPFISNFVQLGAIKFDGAHVLAGDGTGSQAVLLDATNPSALSKITVLQTGVIGISSAALGSTFGVVSGPNSSTVDVISGIPGNPTRTSFNPNNGIGLSTDLSGTTAAIGSKNGGTVKLANVSTQTILGSQSTSLGSVDSITISGSMVAAGSNNNSSMFLINFASPSNPQISNAISVPSAANWTVVLNASPMQLVAGDANGQDVSIFSISTSATGKPSATLLKSVNSNVPSIGTACVTSF